MTGKSWLITGVSSGLGKALAEAALNRGDRVAGTVRREDQAAAFARLAPGRSHPLIIDIFDASVAPAMVDRAVLLLGGLDILVNNAGYALVGAVEEAGIEEAQAIFATNVIGALAIMKAALPHLRANGGGRIINIASMAALQGLRGLGLYCASKSAMAALSETLDIEAARFGVRVTSVEATAFRTEFAGGSLRRMERKLPEYDAMRGEMDAAFARSNGNQPNDPVKGAAALIALAEMPDPPRHFALGCNAPERVAEILEARLGEYARHAELGKETGFG